MLLSRPQFPFVFKLSPGGCGVPLRSPAGSGAAGSTSTLPVPADQVGGDSCLSCNPHLELNQLFFLKCVFLLSHEGDFF